ncbi:MAG TPA: hypothetical protein VKB93_22355 [Thermoanaerobaculia bacterium]|nr:hypothetical protein [Thermoanaerobaculia bacterium]
MKGERAAIAVALTSAAIRLLPLQWLHPLNWDEIEFYRATRWIGEGKVPFRDFWEHHSPLSWFLFAPFSRLTDSPGVSAIISMRWAQIPVWIAAFWLANIFMRNAGLSRFARWAAMAIALSSSFLMLSAVEYRIDPLGCALYLGALVLWQRNKLFFAGVLFCLTGLTNMRLGPLLVVTVLFLLWRSRLRGLWIAAGGLVTLALPLLYFTLTNSWSQMILQLLRENVFGDKNAAPIVGQFVHRLIIVFGVRVIGSDRLFEWAAVDAGGIALLALGFTGLVFALRSKGDLFMIAILQLANLAVIATMNFIYNYHFQLVVLLMLPLIALTIERIPRRSIVLSVLSVVFVVSAFAAIFRGKELDLAYQDFLMRQVHARTKPGEKVWAGMGWALRREPAYHYWFLPDMTRLLVTHGKSAPYRLEDILRDPPALVVCDHYAMVWLARVQRELAPFFVHHYIAVWRNLWVPAMNVRLQPRSGYEWIVPRDGTYVLYASPELAKHRWFRDPLFVGAFETAREMRTEFTLPPPGGHPQLRWWIDRQPVLLNRAVALRKGQRVGVAWLGAEPIGIVLLGSNDKILFRQPPPGATLEASTTRVTHVPRIGL